MASARVASFSWEAVSPSSLETLRIFRPTPESPAKHLQLAMRSFPSSFAIMVTDTTRARSIRAAFLSLLFVVPAYVALPQAGVHNGAEIRDHFQRAQKALQANDAGTAEKEFRAILVLDPRNGE